MPGAVAVPHQDGPACRWAVPAFRALREQEDRYGITVQQIILYPSGPTEPDAPARIQYIAVQRREGAAAPPPGGATPGGSQDHWLAARP